MISRRDFLKDASWALATAGMVHPSLSWGADQSAAPAVTGKQGMILRSFRFLDLEMPTEFMNTWITPVPHFFVRNHMFEPSTLDAGEWRLRVSGEVEKPLSLSLTDLRKIESHSVINTLECAGNGRGFQSPHVPGMQWQRGAVGNARFRGPRLGDLLRRAGVKPAGKYVMFHGLDEVPGKVPPFIRSIPVEKAMDSDSLIATSMNGAPLTRHHGFPARALVPGWIGAASCKWLSEIKVLDQEFEGNFMKPGYRMPDRPIEPDGSANPDATHPITGLSVKSVIAGPKDGTTLKHAAVEIHGAAWAGEADVTKVEISTDSGVTWTRAQLGTEHAHYAWRLWSYWWKPSERADYLIMSRASDSQGRMQPTTAVWNPSGYLYNAIDQVKVHVQA